MKYCVTFKEWSIRYYLTTYQSGALNITTDFERATWWDRPVLSIMSAWRAEMIDEDTIDLTRIMES